VISLVITFVSNMRFGSDFVDVDGGGDKVFVGWGTNTFISTADGRLSAVPL